MTAEFERVYTEFCKATTAFPPFNSAHEGYAVLKEEVDELWDVVKTNPKRLPGGRAEHKQRIHDEAMQVAAMAIRLMVDVCR